MDTNDIMIKIKRTILFGFVLLIGVLANAQIIDKHGLRIGGGFSNQYWENKNDMLSNLSGWKEDKLGLSIKYVDKEK